MLSLLAANAIFVMGALSAPTLEPRALRGQFAQVAFLAAAPPAGSGGKLKLGEQKDKKDQKEEGKLPEGHSSSHPSPGGSGNRTMAKGFVGFWSTFLGAMTEVAPYLLGMGTFVGLIGMVGGLMKGQVEAIWAIPACIVILFVFLGLVILFFMGLAGVLDGWAGDYGRFIASTVALAIPAGFTWLIASARRRPG